MNMEYHKGQFVGYVTDDREVSVPMPRRWYLRQCSPGKDARVMTRLRLINASAWSPTLVRFIDRRTGKVARQPHLGRRVETPFLPGLIFIPDFELDNPALAAVFDLGDYMRIAISGGGRVARASQASSDVGGYAFASINPDAMTELREIVDAENGARVGRGQRGPAKYKPGDKVYIVDANSALFAFAAEIQKLDSRGRLRVFIGALMRGVSATLSETQVEPA